MANGRRLARFGSGTLLGAGVGVAVAILFAPESGNDLRRQLKERIRQVKLAGLQAQAAKTEELIHKFRETVNDPDALADKEAEAHQLVNTATLELATTTEPSAVSLPS